MSKFGVFLIPNKSLVKEIIDIKKYFNSISINNKYINHPPHSSLYVFDTDKQLEDSVIQAFTKLDNQIIPISCNLSGWNIFENDTLAGGLNTLYMGIEPKSQLFEIQSKVVKKLYKFHVKKSYSFPTTKPFKKSLETYGYPFVGSHWIPHLTVGALDLNINDINNHISYFKLKNKKFLIDSISLYSIKKEKHNLIKRLNLKYGNS